MTQLILFYVNIAARPMKTACIKILMLIYTAAQKRGVNTFSDKMVVYVYWPSAMLLTVFLFSALN